MFSSIGIDRRGVLTPIAWFGTMKPSVSLEGAVCSMPKKAERPRELGQYIVANPWICHGEPIFKETRKLVRDCIELAANGLTIDELASRAHLPREAIVEALPFAADVLELGNSLVEKGASHPMLSLIGPRRGESR